MEKKQNNFPKDERFWTYTKNKNGSAFAILRFLPPPMESGSMPYVELYRHAFQGPFGWYIENSPSTLRLPCPVIEYNNRKLGGKKWDDCSEDVKDDVRTRSRKLDVISNILVIKDENNPDNNGKVFLWRYPMEILSKIKEKLKPEFESENAVNVFDLFEGANFKLSVKTVDKRTKYGSSEWDTKSALSDEDAERVLKSVYDLRPFVAESNFKPYNELKERFNRVMGVETGDYKSSDKQESSAPKREPFVKEPPKDKVKDDEEKADGVPDEEVPDGDDFFGGLDK